MAYTYNIPNANDQLSVSQGQIKNNFIALGAIAGNATAGSSSLNSTVGFNYVYLANNAVTPTYTAGTSQIFTQTYAPTGRGELFVLNDSSPTNAGVPMTAALYQNNGYAFLPSGILFKWGVVTVNGTVTVTFTGPAYSFVFNAQATVQATTGTGVVNVNSLSTTQLVLTSSSNRPIYWFVIGY
jgi:hypothetical protein